MLIETRGGFALGWNYLFKYWFLCPAQVCPWELFDASDGGSSLFGLLLASSISSLGGYNHGTYTWLSDRPNSHLEVKDISHLSKLALA